MSDAQIVQKSVVIVVLVLRPEYLPTSCEYSVRTRASVICAQGSATLDLQQDASATCRGSLSSLRQ